MSLTRIDWSHGPVPCSGCGRPMRPGHREPVADWADTTIYGGHGCCRACRKRQRTAGGGVSETGSIGDENRHFPWHRDSATYATDAEIREALAGDRMCPKCREAWSQHIDAMGTPSMLDMLDGGVAA